MRKIILLTVTSLVLILGGCTGEKKLATTPAVEEPKYVTEGTTNFSGTVLSIEDDLVTLEDGTMVRLTGKMLLYGQYISMIVEKGETDYEFNVKEINYQSTVLVNDPSNTLEVVIEDGVSEVSGIYNIYEGNIIQIKDKRFIISENTIFPGSFDDEQLVIDNLKSKISVGTYITGYGIKNEDNEIVSGTVSIVMIG